MPRAERFEILDITALTPRACPCGTTRRAFADRPGQVASLHLLEVSEEAQVHYHQRMTEMYYVLEGHGHLEVDGDRFPIRPGMAAMIHPGCRHRALGDLKILVIPVPAFDPSDEFFD